MTWLHKTSKIITVEQTGKDIESALNYIADQCTWTLYRAGRVNNIGTSGWWTIGYVGTLHNSPSPNYSLSINMYWEGSLEDQYKNEVGSSGLHFMAQLSKVSDGNPRPLMEEQEFDTATEIAQFVKNIIGNDNDGDDESPDFTPDPTESAPVNEPSLISAKNRNKWKMIYATRSDDYAFVEQLYNEAIQIFGNRNMQKIFNYMSPRLRERGLNPKEWINWIFRKKMI